MTEEKTCQDEPEVFGPNLPSNLRPEWIGFRFMHREIRWRDNGSMIATKVSKPRRRMLRARMMELTTRPIDALLRHVRAGDQEVQRLATNSHEAKRMIAADRRERREARLARNEAQRQHLLKLQMMKAAGTDKPVTDPTPETPSTSSSPDDSSASPSPRP